MSAPAPREPAEAGAAEAGAAEAGAAEAGAAGAGAAEVKPTGDWPATRGLDELHPVTGAVAANAGQHCPACGTHLWDPNNEAGGPHTKEVCAWNRAYVEDMLAGGAGHRPRSAPFDYMTVEF